MATTGPTNQSIHSGDYGGPLPLPITDVWETSRAANALPEIGPNDPRYPILEPELTPERRLDAATWRAGAEESAHSGGYDSAEAYVDATAALYEPPDEPPSPKNEDDVLRTVGGDLIRAAAPLIGLDLADFIAAGSGRVEWMLEGGIVHGALCQWLGSWESFKTMAMLQLGACSATGRPWLGMAVEDAPFLYVSNEKSPETIRDRLRRIMPPGVLRDRVVIVHRRGVRFDRRWDEVIRRAEDMGGPFVGLDTLSSLAPAGWNENRSEHMSVALDAIRQLTSTGATAALAHHPSKVSGGGVGRGHGSLDGEVDGTLEFDRPEREGLKLTLGIRPKDGEHRRLGLIWNPDTFLLEVDPAGVVPTPALIALALRDLYDPKTGPVTATRLRAEFPAYGERAFRDRLDAAVAAKAIRREGSGSGTAYTTLEGGGE